MTNKVKPFYIRITDDMTPQTASDVKDKCIKQGANGDFHFNPSDIKRWKYLGVCSQYGLCYSDFTENFYGNAQEITLDQLDEWLGLEVDQGWDGKGLPPVGFECEMKYKHAKNSNWRKCKVFAYSSEHGSAAAVWHLDDQIWRHHSINTSEYEFRKPETPEQKAERERLEAAYDLYCHAKKESVYSCVIVSFKEFIGDFSAREREEYLAIVDKTGYRKQ